MKNLPTGLWVDAETERIAMIRGPSCGRENYCMNVLSGICTWCGYDANKNFIANNYGDGISEGIYKEKL